MVMAASVTSVLVAALLLFQGPGIEDKPVNLDEHGEFSHKHAGKVADRNDKIAGEDGATLSVRDVDMDGVNGIGLFGAAAIEPRRVAPIMPVYTRSYSPYRTGLNDWELLLAPNNVAGLRLLFTHTLPGDDRGLEAQPLLVPRVELEGGEIKDLAIYATMGNNVYAFDAGSKQLIWAVRLGNPIKGTKAVDGWMINDQWGILSTPVISDGVLYCVAWSSVDRSVGKAMHYIHALSVKDGRHVAAPLSLANVTYDPGKGLPVQRFDGLPRKQRSSLTLSLDRKTVFIPFGTIREIAQGAHGWLIAYDVESNSIKGSFTFTSRTTGGGVWQAGQGLSIDREGYLYALTSNGGFDAVTEWGECFVKLQYTGAGFKVIDWWSPWMDSQRGKGGGWDDMDLGSGGVVNVESLGAVIGSGKDGILYALDRYRMGQTKPGDLTGNQQANYRKLLFPPAWFTYYNPTLSAAPQDPATLNVIYGGLTHHEHATPVVFDRGNGDIRVYNWGENGNLRSWRLSRTGIEYLAAGQETASFESPRPPGGMPGGMITVSSSGADNALVWALVPSGDANREITEGSLMVYDALNYNNGAMRLLWNSGAQGIRFKHPKFNVPVVDGGRVYVPTYDGRVLVLGID